MNVVTSIQPAATSDDLFLLGKVQDPSPERGVRCPGALPAPADPGLVERAARAKAALGDRVVILGHHYQNDDIIGLSDVLGDSFKLARDAAARPEAEYIVFCGVHFMAESADILTSDRQAVLLPDLAAGCSMADMASSAQVERCWQRLREAGLTNVVPVTYMNSSASIKAFVGRHGGVVCTSSNAERVLRWALGQGGGDATVLFLPDQHLGRNTAVRQLGMAVSDCLVYDPAEPGGGLSDPELANARILLWKGHCSVHARFTRSSIDEVRRRVPGIRVIVHPECAHDVVLAADEIGSTERIIQAVEASPSGTAWAVGTELNLVRRLAARHPDKRIVFPDRAACYCSTMGRIDLPHLVTILEALLRGEVLNRVTVDQEIAVPARSALDRMLALG